MGKVLIAVLVVTITMIVVLQFIDPNSLINAATSITTTQTLDGNSISVSINGEITRSGTYILELNTTLNDLIQVASGVTTNADPLAYDTSYLLSDGLSFYIPPKYDNTDVCSMEPIKKVNINVDAADKLQEVSGIGSAAASAIVTYRNEVGQFKRIEDLKLVNGIGNATFEKIKNYVVLRSS
ncbi:MAG: helix-hairpin-helix domain-containing protein [Bacilli bacterium]|nr:helix-hairpin-helix domain-containing protein [Bacilli bacterium]